MYRERNIFRFLLLFILCLFITNTSAKCFGKSCTGWECHCSNTALDVCPIKGQNIDGALTCPNPNTACESTIKIPYPWTPPGWTGPACQIGNVARGKTVTMSSTYYAHSGSKCVDGRTVSATNTWIGGKEICHTEADQDAWIRIDLGTQYVVHNVTLWDRTDAAGCTAEWSEWKKRARNMEIRVGNEYGTNTSISTSNPICAYQGPPLCGKNKTSACSTGPIVGQYVTVQHKNIGKAEYLALAEIEVIGFKYIAPGDCSKGSNSFGCMIECYPCYNSESCNYLNGTCQSGCSQNYIGKWCESEFKLFSPLTKYALTDYSVKVSWTAYSGSVVDSGRGTVSVHYQVDYRKISENTWTNQESAGVLTHHTITGLTPDTGYKIAVRLQKLGNSQLVSTASLTSPVLNVQTLCADPLNGPKDVRVVSTAVENSNTWPQTTNLILAWTALTAAQLQCDVTKTVYQVKYKQLNGQTWTTTVAQPTGHTLTGLEPYTDYEVRVGVKNDVTQKFIYNQTINYQTPTAGNLKLETDLPNFYHRDSAPGPVTSLTVSRQTNSGFRVTCSTPDKPNGIIIQYRLWYKLLRYKTCPTPAQGGEPKEISLSSNTAVEHVFTGLKPYAEYEITVSAETSAGGLDLNKRTVTGITLQSEPTGKPDLADVTVETIPNSVSKPDTYIDATFKDLACENQHGPLKHYRYKLLEKDTMKLVKDGTTSNKQFRIDKLIPFTEYELTYNWVNSKGSSEESPSKIFTTDEAVPGVPIPEARSAAPNSIIFAWSSPVPPLARIIKYNFMCGNATKNNSDQIQEFIREDVEPTVLTKTVTGLTQNKWYGCQVMAQGKKGWGPWSKKVHFLTQVGIPGPPASLDFSFTRDTLNTTLTWTPPNRPNGDITNYRLTCEPISSTSTTPLSERKTFNKPEIEGSTTTINITTSLIPFTQYNCSIFASTSKGESLPASVSFWTTGKITIPKLVIKKTAVTDTTVTLQIPRVNNTGNITGYEVIVKKHDGPINRRHNRTVNQSQYVSYEKAKQRGLSVYITAAFLPPKEPSEFIVGDTRNYSGYFNAPLETGKSYSFILGIVENYYGEIFRHYPPIEQQERITVKAPSNNAGIIGGVVAAVLILLLVAVVLVIVWRRGGFKTKETSHNAEISIVNISPSDKIIGKPLARLKGIPRQENTAFVNSTFSRESSAYFNIYDDPRPVNGKQDGEDHHYEIASKGATMICDLLGETLMKTSDEWKNMDEEFQSVLRLRRGLSECAEKVENLEKNRFPNILAYDSTRVVLEQTGEEPTSDYINANYIRGLTGHLICIACQAPLLSTINDHWRMIWQEKCPAIIVLTDLTEGQGKDKKVKCHRYWPTKLDAIGRYGDITVTVAEKMEKHTEPPAVVHFLSITKRGHKQAHNLLVCHYRGWPDHGVPFPASSVVRMQQFIKQRLTDPDQGLVLIHGSAGAGRTGCYIATEQLLEKAKKDGLVNVFDMFRKLRQQRPEMIQNMKQYILVHQILLEELILGPVAYTTTSFRESYEERKATRPVSKNVSDKIEEQFLVFKASTPIQDEESLAVAKLLNNVNKSRYKDILPEAQYQPQLSHKGFINASFVHTITNDNVFIATQSPLQKTITDFWQMIFDYNCELIVMMHQEYPQDPTYASYYPAVGSIKFGPFTITVKEVQLPCKTIVRRDLILQKQNESRRIRQIQFLGWPEDKSVPDLQYLFEFVKLVTREHVTSPIVVHCMNSTTRTGLFCAAFELITKVPSSEQIDIYHSVQKLRMTRPQFIPNLEQYKLLHDLVIFNFHGFDTYMTLN
ncbi:receptor-type tyrosine-protein phosphatase kappa-like [Tubulanus polymorphus]|uniref:receptor-type tyrosine-protein phosphatase kappa-like n=1 Tax=Tubulanus polymorphus TaxID=672921 RepID=UPI003DA435FC